MDDMQALLKLLAMADKEIEAEETVPIEEVIKEIRNRRSGTRETWIGASDVQTKNKKCSIRLKSPRSPN
ncbi:MAG: hypothetical protein ABSC77_14210 [Terracidiphilus sp.]